MLIILRIIIPTNCLQFVHQQISLFHSKYDQNKGVNLKINIII